MSNEVLGDGVRPHSFELHPATETIDGEFPFAMTPSV